MRQYEVKETINQTNVVNKLVCNKCGKEVHVINGIPEQELCQVDMQWGYFSNKDGEKHSFDLCEECYDELVKSFKIPVQIKE